MARYTCPVCSYPHLSESPRSELGGGSFEICPSCSFQFGVHDDDEGISYEKWRASWISKGMPWSSYAVKQPETWIPANIWKTTAAAPVVAKKAAPAPSDDEEADEAPEPKKPAKKVAAKEEKPAKKAAKKAAPAKKAAKKK